MDRFLTERAYDPLTPPFFLVVAANGQKLDLLGQCEVLMSVRGLPTSHSVTAARELV